MKILVKIWLRSNNKDTILSTSHLILGRIINYKMTKVLVFQEKHHKEQKKKTQFNSILSEINSNIFMLDSFCTICGLFQTY